MLDLLASPWIPFLTFLGGLLVGHRLALGRDRRNDYNAALDSVREGLLGERRSMGYRAGPRATDNDVDRLRALMGWRQRRQWDTAWQRLEQERNRPPAQDSAGQPIYAERQWQAAIDDCLAVARWR